MELLLLSRVNELTSQVQSKIVSKRKFENIKRNLPIAVPVLINQDISKSYNNDYGIEPTDKKGAYIGSFKEFIGDSYKNIVNDVFDFKYIYINLNELNPDETTTKEFKKWIRAYNTSKSIKNLRENLEIGVRYERSKVEVFLKNFKICR